MTSEEQAEYDALYAKGFDESLTSTEDVVEEDVVEEEQEEAQEETEEQPQDEDESEQEDETLDEEEESDTTEEEESDSDEKPEPKKRTLKYKGQELSLTEDERDALAQKGFDYTAKTQDLSLNRADIEFMAENGLSHKDLVMLNDIKNGNKEALAKLANTSGIDPIDVEDDSAYVPEVKETNYALKDAVDAIKADTENAPVIDGYISALPQSVKDVFVASPNILSGLHQDVRDGLAKEIMPEVIKQMAINPNADFMQLYASVGNQVVSAKGEAPKKETKPEAKRETKKRASVTKSKSNANLKEHQDVWNDDKLFKDMKAQLARMK